MSSMASTTSSQSAYGRQMAKYFRLPSADSLVIPSRSKPPIAITRLASGVGLPERTASIPPERAYVVSIHLTPAGPLGCDLWVDDKHTRIPTWPAGGVGIYDLESNPRTRNVGPVDWVHYHIPRCTLDSFTDDFEQRRIERLQCSPGTVDQVLQQMTEMILPALQNQTPFSGLFLDYFRLLLCTHVTMTYAPGFGGARKQRGGLAPWQRRRVTEFIRDNFESKLRLTTLAGECGLSVSHFARSFRRTFGMSAHRYLISQRVESAKLLLSEKKASLLDVALRLGFSDQATFSRAFKSIVGAPPGPWQREFARSSFAGGQKANVDTPAGNAAPSEDSTRGSRRGSHSDF